MNYLINTIVKHKFLAGLLIIILLTLIISLSTYKNFGTTADEELEYKSGKALMTYYLTGKDPENTGLENRHLPSYSTYFRTIPAIFSLVNTTGYYERYHVLNMLFGSLLFIAMFLILFYEYKKIWISLFGTFLLFLTPRLTGDIPANPKDIPFAISYFITLILIHLVNKQNYSLKKKIFLLGPIFGITYAIRLVGLSLFPIYFLYSLISQNFSLKKSRQVLLEMSGILSISFIILMPLWPALRNNFPQNISYLFENATNFGHWDHTNLFQGKFLTKDQRPTEYLPIWILITTPLVVLVPFFCSPYILYISKHSRKILVLMYLALGINFSAYFLTKPLVYNGIRHFLYLLPPIVFISYISSVEIFKLVINKSKLLSRILILVYLIGILSLIQFFVNFHPYQYIYFNEIIGGTRGASGKFDLDYWGATYKEATEWLRDNTSVTSGLPKVYACNVGYVVQYYNHGKIEVVRKESEADYIICDSDNDRQHNWTFPVVHEVKRNGITLNLIRKAK
jgi:hypothetical protein